MSSSRSASRPQNPPVVRARRRWFIGLRILRVKIADRLLLLDLVAAIAFAALRVPFTSTRIPFTTPSQLTSSHFVAALVRQRTETYGSLPHHRLPPSCGVHLSPLQPKCFDELSPLGPLGGQGRWHGRKRVLVYASRNRRCRPVCFPGKDAAASRNWIVMTSAGSPAFRTTYALFRVQ